HACVGRKLVLGSLEDGRPGMVSRILSILINERTGTTVEVNYYQDPEELFAAVAKGKVDLYVDHVDSAIKRLKVDAPGKDEEERYRAVKRRFEEELNLIWLKPMGYSGVDRSGQDLGQASVVVSKDTLKKFPALPRLLEKIGTRVVLDDKSLDNLVARSGSVKPAKVARDYLKEVKLI
ncbi:MAG: hypothetical protein JSV70_07295, partial [bacterium]